MDTARHVASETVIELGGERAAPRGPLVISAARWSERTFDPTAIDGDLLDAAGGPGNVPVRIVVRDGAGAGDARAVERVAGEVAIRYQRYLAWLPRARNRHSAAGMFDRVLARHRELHDLSKPLVAADYDHALDTWRWTLRLSADASTAIQIAALFHDVERLASEADARLEHHARDYNAFKDRHAALGAEMAYAILAPLDLPPDLLARVQELVTEHERPGEDLEKELLAAADALSFFSLNSTGFIAYFGPGHTRRKIAHALARLPGWARLYLGRIRLRADVMALLRERVPELPPARTRTQ